MDKVISIFIADDHPLVIDGLMGYLEDKSKYLIKGTANNGRVAFEMLKEMDVDLLLTDIQMPQMDGAELSKQLLSIKPYQKIITLTMFDEVQYIRKMLQVGVMGYVLKNSSKSEIERAIQIVVAGGQFYSQEVTQVIMNKLRGGIQKGNGMNDPSELTDREREILYLILKQFSNQDIANQLFISTRTVEAHKRNLLEKTGSKNVAGLVLYAIEHRIFEDF